jgi:hypothetical protein
LKPLIQTYAEMYVSALDGLHTQKVNAFRGYLIAAVVIFILAAFNALSGPNVIHILSSVVLAGLGVYLYQAFQENLNASKEIGSH